MGSNRYVPEEIKEALDNYLNYGQNPGSFGMSVLHNNLSESVYHADHIEKAFLGNIIGYVYNSFPPEAWGSVEKVRAWMDLKQQELANIKKGQDNEDKDQ